MAFVLATSALVFEPPADPADLVEALEDPASTSPNVTLPAGEALRVTGDIDDVLSIGDTSIECGGSFGGVANPFCATTSDGKSVSLEWEHDEDGRLFLRHFQLDRYDFFLDPGECTLTPGDIGSDGAVPAQVECPEISDIRDTATVSMSGTIGFSYQDFPPPGIIFGGEVTLGGDIEATVTVDTVDWVVRPAPEVESDFPDPEVSATNQSDQGFLFIDFARGDDGKLYVLSLQISLGAFAYFQPEPGQCPASEEFLEETSAVTAVYKLTFSCSSISSTQVEGIESDLEYTISLEGALTGHRLDLTGS